MESCQQYDTQFNVPADLLCHAHCFTSVSVQFKFCLFVWFSLFCLVCVLNVTRKVWLSLLTRTSLFIVVLHIQYILHSKTYLCLYVQFLPATILVQGKNQWVTLYLKHIINMHSFKNKFSCDLNLISCQFVCQV